MSLLGSNVTAFSPASQSLFYQARAGFMAAGSDLTTATSRAYASLFGLVQRQATMMAFVSLFQLLGVTFIAVIPLVMLMKRPRGRSSAPAAH